MSMLWKVVSIVTLAAVIGVAALVVSLKNPVAYAAPSTASAENAMTGITVSAQGTAEVKPDVAYISVGVRTTAKTAAEAMTQNNTAMAAVIAKIQALGIDRKDIQTGTVSLQPQTNQPRQEAGATPEITGYWATNSVNVTVNDLTKVGSVLDEAITAGANSIDGIRFDVKDKSPIENQALTAAVKNARAKADVVAAGLGLKVTGVQNVQINSYTPMPYYAGAAKMAMDSAGGSVPVEAGQVTVTAQVQVTFTF